MRGGTLTIDVSGEGYEEWLKRAKGRKETASAVFRKTGLGEQEVIDKDGEDKSQHLGPEGSVGETGVDGNLTPADNGIDGNCSGTGVNGRRGFPGLDGGTGGVGGQGGEGPKGGDAGDIDTEITNLYAEYYTFLAKGGQGGTGGKGGRGGPGGMGGKGGKGGPGGLGGNGGEGGIIIVRVSINYHGTIVHSEDGGGVAAPG